MGRHRVGAAWSGPGSRRAAADAQGAGAIRHHRSMGGRRQRRLALPDDGRRRRATTAACRSIRNGRRAADAWDPARDEAAGEQCRAYGVAGLMRLPTRVRISWIDDQSLKIESDAGTQTRTIVFGPPRAQGGDWQGVSVGQLGSLGGSDRRRILSRRRRTRRLAQGRDDENEAGLPAQERRSLQRRHRRHGVLRSLRRARAATRCSSCRPRSSTRRTSRSRTGRAAISRSRATLQDGIQHHAPHADRRGRSSVVAACAVLLSRRRRRAGLATRRLRDSTSPATGRRRSTKTRSNGARARSSATTAASRSTKPRGCSRCRTTPRASRCVIISATATSRRTPSGRSATRAPGKSAIRTRSGSSPFTGTTRRSKGIARSGWTGVRIRRRRRRTRGWAFRPDVSSGRRSKCRRRISSRGGCGETACRRAIRRRWSSSSCATAIT